MDGKRCRVLGFGVEERKEDWEGQTRTMQRTCRALTLGRSRQFSTAKGRLALLQAARMTGPAGAPPPGEQPGEVDVPVPDTTVPGSNSQVHRPAASSTCYWYTWYEADSDRAAREPGASKTPGIFDSCDPAWTERSADFSLCLADDFTFNDAVNAIVLAQGADWESAVWSSVDGLLEGARLTDAEFESLVPSWPEGAGEWNTSWDPSPDGMNYQAASDTPRLALLRAALDLIVCFPKGVPETIEGHEVRKHVVDPIRDGWMEYHLYTEGGGWTVVLDVLRAALSLTMSDAAAMTDLFRFGIGNKWAVVAATPLYGFLRDMEDVIVHTAFKSQWLVASGWQVTGTPTTLNAVAVAAAPRGSGRFSGTARGPGLGCVMCPDAGVVDLRGDASFTFQFFNVKSSGGHGANHGVFTPRVWTNPSHVDRGAVMYDWFFQLAVRHFAASLDTDLELWIRNRHALASNICLRRASSAAAEFANLLVHETAHNLNLYHCYDPFSGKPQHCYQDVAAYAWWVYVQAKLGIARTEHFSVAFPVTTASSNSYWTILNSTDYVDDYLLGWAIKGDSPGALRVKERVLECNQGDALTDDWKEALVLGGATTALMLMIPFGALGPTGIVLQICIASFIVQMQRIVGEKVVYRNLEFVIRHPLVMGSDVSQCCVHRDENCLDGEDPASPCWEDGVTAKEGCCDDSGDGGGGGGEPGDGGIPLPPRPSPFGPFFDPDDPDDPTVLVDGVAVM